MGFVFGFSAVAYYRETATQYPKDLVKGGTQIKKYFLKKQFRYSKSFENITKGLDIFLKNSLEKYLNDN